MGVVFQLLAAYAPYVYLVCGLVALYQLYRLWQVRADRRQAVFTLERDRAVRELSGIFTVAVFLLAIMGVTYAASRAMPESTAVAPMQTPAPTLPPEFSLQIIPTNTPLAATPTATATATQTPVPTAAPLEPAAEATLTAEATAEPTAPPPPVIAAPASCPDERSVITSPANGSTVSGVFNIQGTATHEIFSYYKVEFAPGANAEGGFTYLADGRGPVFDGALANVDTRSLGNGPWTFQLTVVDQTGNFPNPCRVTVNVQN